MYDWSKFDKKVDVEELNHDLEDLNSGGFEELPLGKYEVRLDSLEMKPTKEKGYPMLVMSFTVVEGQYEKRKIFVNQVLYMGDQNDKYRMNTANQLLESLDSGLDVAFKGFRNYENLIDAIADKSVDEEYLLEIGERKGFRNYKIIEHYNNPF